MVFTVITIYVQFEATYLCCCCAVGTLGGVRCDGGAPAVDSHDGGATVAGVGQVVAEEAGQPAIGKSDYLSSLIKSIRLQLELMDTSTRLLWHHIL